MNPRIVRHWITEEQANTALKSINLIQQTKIWIKIRGENK